MKRESASGAASGSLPPDRSSPYDLPHGAAWADADGAVRAWDPSTSAVCGFPCGALGSIDAWFRAVGVDDEEHAALTRWWQALHEETPGVAPDPARQVRGRGADGASRWILLRATPTRAGTLVTFSDVSELRRSRREARALSALADFARTHSADEILRRTLDELEELTDSRVGFFHLVAGDGRTIRLQTWSTRTLESFCEAAPSARHESLDQAGVWAEAVRRRAPVVHNDYAALPEAHGLPEGHADLTRELVVPVLRGGQVVAVFGLGNRPEPYTEHDVRAVVRFANAAWNVAEWRMADEQLLSADRRLLDTLHSLPIPALALDVDGRVSFANPAALRMFGYDEGDFVGRDWFETVIPDEGRASLRALFNETMAGRTPLLNLYENRVIVRGGEERTAVWHSTLLHGPRGMIAGVLTVGEDVTERRRAEEALREARDRYRLIAEHTDDVIWVYGLSERTLRFVTPSAERLLGRSVDTLMTDAVLFGIPVEELLRREEAWRAGDEQARSVVERVALAVGDGETVTAEVSTTLVRDAESGSVHVLGVARDITERVRDEEERLVLERHLLRRQKLDALGVLAGGIAHDYNNLLLAIIGNLELAMEELEAASSTRVAVELALGAGRRAAELTDQMLTYAGRSDVAVSLVDLNQLVRDDAPLLRAAASHGASVELELAPDPSMIRADVTDVRQLLMGIVSNALEAVGAGGGVVRVATGTRTADTEELARGFVTPPPAAGRFACLEVSDNGVGMDEETLARVCEPFFSTKFTGRGLGMAAVVGVLRTHGGSLLVDSAPGLGTTVVALWPEAPSPGEG